MNATDQIPANKTRGAETAPGSPLGSSVAWIRDFLARPHRGIGRAGPVCPFTPMALELDTIWPTEIAETASDPQRIQGVIEQCRQDRILREVAAVLVATVGGGLRWALKH